MGKSIPVKIENTCDRFWVSDGNRQERSHSFIAILKIALEIITAQMSGKPHNSENVEYMMGC
ncbi:hypothetical protein [Nostoc commune]|uniref:hypothetical protein n=1 Tax=Nostoc commune TaxID=1178 RepID=UPI000D59907D|nr:hypothetical protein [Nostoc commune]